MVGLRVWRRRRSEPDEEAAPRAPALIARGRGTSLPAPGDEEALRLACVSGKGGVGKTTTVISVAAAFGELGLATLAIDCDPQANLTFGLGLDDPQPTLSTADVLTGRAAIADAVVATPWEGVWLLPATRDLDGAENALPSGAGKEIRLRDALRRSDLLGRFAAVVFDSPPSFGFHTLNVLAATRYVVAPLAMSGFAIRGLKEVLRVMRAERRELNPDLELLGVLPTFVDMRTRMSRDLLTAICELDGLRVFAARIPESAKLQESSLLRVPITAYAGSSRAAGEYRSLARDILAATQSRERDDSADGETPLRLSSP